MKTFFKFYSLEKKNYQAIIFFLLTYIPIFYLTTPAFTPLDSYSNIRIILVYLNPIYLLSGTIYFFYKYSKKRKIKTLLLGIFSTPFTTLLIFVGIKVNMEEVGTNLFESYSNSSYDSNSSYKNPCLKSYPEAYKYGQQWSGQNTMYDCDDMEFDATNPLTGEFDYKKYNCYCEGFNGN